MQYLTCNFTGAIKRRRLNGREHLVVPLTMIVPGVLNGSNGALYYPPSEIRKSADKWNSIPIVVYHPQVNGEHVSAADSDILDNQGIGTIRNARANGKLRAEGWLDIEKLRQVDGRILDSLEAGKPIELSTGLFTQNDPAPEGATYQGKPYSFVAKNYVPDHLAFLPDQVGACSIADGCGVLVNQSLENNMLDQNDILELPVLAWNMENQASKTKGKKEKGFVEDLKKKEKEQQEELEHETERQSKKTQMEIMQEEEERLHRENSRRLSRISANLDQDDILPLPVLNWQEDSDDDCDDCDEDFLPLPQSAF